MKLSPDDAELLDFLLRGGHLSAFALERAELPTTLSVSVTSDSAVRRPDHGDCQPFCAARAGLATGFTDAAAMPLGAPGQGTEGGRQERIAERLSRTEERLGLAEERQERFESRPGESGDY